ncbi:MAG: putative acetyltransferase [Planctomycetota bacterium]|jgi:putative acetyltransferase
MQPQVDGTSCTPAQCHVLIEVSQHGQMTSIEVAELLSVDKSTASRALQSLALKGLLELQVDAADQRAKPMRMSKKGARLVHELHEQADEFVGRALAHLSEKQRATVVEGVILYEDALRRARALDGVIVRPLRRADQADMAQLIRDVLAEFGAVGGGFSSEDVELKALHSAYAGPRTSYFVAERAGELLAGSGFAPLASAGDDKVCELQKMFARPSARGIGVGRVLLTRCLDAAREADYRTCYLETLEHMRQARALYEKVGFRALTAPLGDTGHSACNTYYALELTR